MKVERCAFELQADNGVEFFDYKTSAELLTLSKEQVREFFQWWLADKMTLRDIVKQLNHCGYTCIAGPLELNVAFIALGEMAERTDQ